MNQENVAQSNLRQNERLVQYITYKSNHRIDSLTSRDDELSKAWSHVIGLLESKSHARVKIVCFPKRESRERPALIKVELLNKTDSCLSIRAKAYFFNQLN